MDWIRDRLFGAMADNEVSSQGSRSWLNRLSASGAYRGRDNYLVHGVLFLLTVASTSIAGAEFVLPASVVASDGFFAHIASGIPFSLLLLLFLSVHEFGHYFAARRHGVDVTLPYYIPMPFFLFGTMGAVIRTRSLVPSRKAMFDIGIAGPLAGFVVAFVYLVVGMMTLPGIESLYAIHPEYRTMATLPATGLHFGDFLLFAGLRDLLVPSGTFFPDFNELYHYPLLAIGWFGMFVTALNLIPIGQLDGGHILYGMFGRRQAVISRWFYRLLLFAGFGGLTTIVLEATRGYDSNAVIRFVQQTLGPVLEWIAHNLTWWTEGWLGWLFWGVLIRVVVKIAHPPTPVDEPLGRGRLILGWAAMVIFLLTISWTGIYE